MSVIKKILFTLFAGGILAVSFAGAQADPACQRTADVIYARKFGTALTMDVFRPANANGIGIIFVVSGGWLSSHDTPNMVTVNPDSLKLFLDRGYTVFAVVHGSQPKFIIPEMVEDLQRAVRFIRFNAKIYGIDPTRLGITGSSSGGHLSLMVATHGDDGNPKATDPVDRESSAVQAVAVFFPPTDFLNWGAMGVYGVTNTMTSMAAAFGPRAKMTGDWKTYGREISPIYFIRSNLPPVVIIHGDADPAVPIQQSERFVQKAKETGASVPKLVVRHGKGHGWSNFWQSKEDIDVFCQWFDEHLKNHP